MMKHGYLQLLCVQNRSYIFKAGAAQGGLDVAQLSHLCSSAPSALLSFLAHRTREEAVLSDKRSQSAPLLAALDDIRDLPTPTGF